MRSGCFFGAIVTVKVNAQKRTEIEKPRAEVYRFIANEHGRDHPRWTAEQLNSSSSTLAL